MKSIGVRSIPGEWLSAYSDKPDSAVYYTYIITPIGKVLLTATNDKLIGVHIDKQKYFPIIEDHWAYNEHIAVFSLVKTALEAYFTGKKWSFSIDYKLYGTDFQINVWSALAKIPYGEVCTYKVLASLTAYPNAIRAVASAIGKNPLSIIVPCHRVVRGDGLLGGYAGGVVLKKQLLVLENVEYKRNTSRK